MTDEEIKEAIELADNEIAEWQKFKKDLLKKKNNNMRNQEEAIEQAEFVKYLRLKGIRFSALTQDTPAGHKEYGVWKPHYQTLKKNKALGCMPGVPDMIVMPIIDHKQYLLFVEMKKAKGKVSKEQKEWIDAINKVEGNVVAKVCYSSGEAIDFIEDLLTKPNLTITEGDLILNKKTRQFSIKK
jgi:hypothetical protein